MKILDKYILKNFIKPFLATFFVVLFVFVMQALWLAFDDIAGKGIDMIFILKFLFYTALIVTPQALPVGVLLSSIMALGNLSENYEFAAVKSAGISLPRLVRYLVLLTILLSVVNFFFLNNVYPYAVFKQKNLYVNIKKQKPALALIPGGFNTEIPSYQIKFDKKYGKNNDLLKGIMIYDLSEGKGNKKIITAKTGKIINPEGTNYMKLVLYDGYFFEDHISFKTQKNMPSSNAFFKEYSIIIDLSSFTSDIEGKENLKNLKDMLSLSQLKDTLPKLNSAYKEYIQGRANNFYRNADAKELHQYKEYKNVEKLAPEILDNFDTKVQLRLINSSITKNKTALDIIKNQKSTFKFKRKLLNIYEIEYYNRVAFSLSCLILFFIGAPLGSIIRKGGFGLPMILAICIYVLYFFINTFGRNLAEDSSISALLGSWISAILMIPVGVLLTVRAKKDKGMFNIDKFLQPITQLIKKIMPKKKTKYNGKYENV